MDMPCVPVFPNRGSDDPHGNAEPVKPDKLFPFTTRYHYVQEEVEVRVRRPEKAYHERDKVIVLREEGQRCLKEFQAKVCEAAMLAREGTIDIDRLCGSEMGKQTSEECGGDRKKRFDLDEYKRRLCTQPEEQLPLVNLWFDLEGEARDDVRIPGPCEFRDECSALQR